MSERNPDTAQKNPENIHECIETARFGIGYPCGFSKRPYGQSCQFKALQAKRDSDYGYTHEKTGYYIFQGDHESPEQQP